MTENDFKPSTWKLDDLTSSFETDVINKSIREIKDLADKIEGMREVFNPDISEKDFLDSLNMTEEFARLSTRLQGAAILRFSADTQDQEALALMGRIEQELTETNNRIMFINLWWRGLDDKNAERLMKNAGDRRYYLKQQRLFSSHTLSEPEEKLIGLKDINGIGAITTLYDIITNKFTFTLDIDGKEKTMSRDELAVFVRHPSADMREAAYREQYRVYENESTVLGQIYINRARDWQSENINMRSFHSPISVRNLGNDIPDEVVETLLDVCKSEADIFRDYFHMKAKRIGLEKLSRFDIYAPVSSAKQENIKYSDALDMVFKSFNEFSPEMGKLARTVLEKEHLDSEVRPGKRGGAFCFSIEPGLEPWVLVNYTGEPRQVATIAHELGHAVHSLLAKDHSILTFHAPLPMAETASVFSEMLLTDNLLNNVTDKATKDDILFETIDNIYATVLRQAFFVLFERDAHEAIQEGKTISQLSDMYLENLKLQFGDAVDIDPLFKNEWISIPHIFHTPFYCYAYSFGMLLSLSLYKRYKEEGTAFAPVLIKILSHGGSMEPALILKEAGIDMSDPNFWRGGFDVIREMIGRLGTK
jgi:oligoendopeptidase F